jgi:hypothetical protein
MKYHALAIGILLISTLSFAQGRKPAVEDFVGIEIEHAEASTPSGTEALFNLEKDLKDIEVPRVATISQAPAKTPFSWNVATFVGVSFLLVLPLVSWLAAMHHMRKKAFVQAASNIEVLENYRKEREAKRRESFKKVS